MELIECARCKSLLAPNVKSCLHCGEPVLSRKSQDYEAPRPKPEQPLMFWCGVRVFVSDEAPPNKLQLPAFNEDPAQQPVFRVNQSLADRITNDYEKYKPRIEEQVRKWLEAKLSRVAAAAQAK